MRAVLMRWRALFSLWLNSLTTRNAQKKTATAARVRKLISGSMSGIWNGAACATRLCRNTKQATAI